MAVQKRVLISLIAIGVSISGFSQSGNNALNFFQKGVEISKIKPEQAYPVFVKAMTLARQDGDWNVYLDALNSNSTLVLNALNSPETRPLGNKQIADRIFNSSKEALTFGEKFKSRPAVAELHYNIGEFYNFYNDVDTALYHYNEAKQMFASIGGEWTKEVAKCYHGLGDVNKYNKLDFYQAEINYEKALSIRERIKFQDTLVLYKNFYSLAATNRSQWDYEKGLSYGTKAMELAKSISPIRVETTTAMVANIYRDMKESDKARTYYLEAISINKKTNILDNRAWYYLCLGETYVNDSLYKDALSCFNQAYPFYRSSKEREDRNLFLYLLLITMEVYVDINEDENFAKVTKEFYNELSQRNEHRGLFASQGLGLQGDFYHVNKNYDSALHYYQKGLVSLLPAFTSLKVEDNPTEEDIGFFYYAYVLLVKKAATLTSKFSETNDPGYQRQSLVCLRLAEKLLSNQRSTLDMDKSKREFLDAQYDLYEDIASRLFEGKKVFLSDTVDALAFRYFEQSKSRSLADALAQAEQSKKFSDKDSLFRIHTDLRRQLMAVQDEVNSELEKSVSSNEIAPLRDEMVTLDRQIQNCKQAIEEKYPGYFNVKYGHSTPSLKEVQRSLKDRGQVALEFFWGSQWVYAMGVSADKVIFKRIGRPDSLRVTINRLLDHFDENSNSTNRANYESFVSTAYTLFSKLVEPFDSLLTGHEHLLIIPDGPINQVPFEVLLREQKISNTIDYRSLLYLIKTYSIGYAYSSAMHMRRKDRVVSTPTLLAVGFTGGSRLRAPQPELEEIVGAEEELEALAKRFKRGKFLVGPEATEANFKTLSPEYDIIHLAIHGRGDIQRNLSSSLYFRTKYDSLDDGELHDYELYGIKLKALMAVLSACESGLGRGYKGEGMISMASAFTYSGCGNILMSLWKVNDKASTVLMDDFYGHLLEGKTIDDALRRAKLDYLEGTDELTSDPKIWAPLVAYGSLEPIFTKSNDRIVVYGAIGAVLLLVILFISRRRRSI